MKMLTTLVLMVTLLTACVIQNAGPVAPDQGLITNKGDMQFYETCDSNPNNYLQFDTQGKYEVGLKSYVKTMASDGSAITRARVHVKKDIYSWSSYQVKFTSAPTSTREVRGFEKTYGMRNAPNGDCFELIVELPESPNVESLVTVELTKKGGRVARVQQTFP